MKRFPLFALLLAGLLALPATAQQTTHQTMPPQAAPQADSAFVGDLPKPAVDLVATNATYDVRLDLPGGTTSSMNSTWTIEETDEGWLVTESVETPQGLVTDRSTLARETLVPVRRVIEQGPMSIILAYAPGMISGTMTMNGQEQPIEVNVDGPLFNGGSGLYPTLASLPLANGYEATFRTFDVQRQQVIPMRIEVVGSGPLEVQAGSFEAFQVELTRLDGSGQTSTFYVSLHDPRAVLKSEAMIPEMNGAVVTYELTSLE
jgi:hypothetical protein